MTPSYQTTLENLYGLTRFGEKMSLDGPRALHERLGSPLGSYDSVLVGGTNGKGSTCIFLESLLRAQGLRVGLFTSPHMNHFAERIRVDGVSLPHEQITDLATKVCPIVRESGGSFFEAVWAMSTLAFARSKVDVAIWEVGLGGRLDATNVAEPVVSAITNIGLDHTHVLGHTHEAIAIEKSAIFRSHAPALTSARGIGLDALKKAYSGVLTLSDPVDAHRPLGLMGTHQRHNAGLAVSIARHLGCAVYYPALEAVSWPGRGEFIDDVLLDCAHNPAGLQALSELVSIQAADEVHVIFGVMEGKDIEVMAKAVDRWAHHVTVVTPNYPRRRPAEEVAAAFQAPHVMSSVGAALDQRSEHALTVVCGSGFLVAEARAHLLGIEYPEFGLRTRAR